jgi:hypothetical protein
MDDLTAERLAANERRFREINERMREDLRGLTDDTELIPFVCECSALSCREGVALRLGEYEAVRADERHFAVVHGHDLPAVERIVGRTDRYLVVAKLP